LCPGERGGGGRRGTMNGSRHGSKGNQEGGKEPPYAIKKIHMQSVLGWEEATKRTKTKPRKIENAAASG